MNVIYLTYANDKDNPLPSLKEEESRINQVLAKRKLDGNFILERDSYATLENIKFHLNKYRDRLIIFSFSGHAGSDRLIFEEGTAHAGGIAALLGQCPNLIMVLLNGCSTAGQVDRLLKEGVPIVVATHAPVGDKSAKDFAIALFEALNENRSLWDAYLFAKGVVSVRNPDINFKESRSADFENDRQDLWGIFWNERTEEEELLKWTFPVEMKKQRNQDILELQSRIHKLVGDTKIKEAVELVTESLKQRNASQFPVALSLKQEFKRLRNRQMMNTISYSEYTRSVNDIVMRLLQLLDEDI